MKNPGKEMLLAWMIGSFCLINLVSVKAQSLWSEVKFNKPRVYVGEPMQVTVTVYTSTWFTAGVDPGNVKVDGAYTVFFRNVSTSKTVKGKTLSGVDMIFNVFPYSGENVTFPELQIEVESPAEGDYQGRAHTIKTKPQEIKVQPIPPGFSQESWLVSNNLSVQQRWSGDFKNVKVGDVLTRTIMRNVSNTVSQLIPPVSWDSAVGVSMYPYRSNVESNRSKTAISATRTETMRYLFEREGEVILPEMEFTWWNAYHKKLYKRTLSEVKIEVQPNPDLGMLASVRDSLEAQIAEAETMEKEAEKPFTILGMSVKRFVTMLLAIVLLVVAFVLLLKWGINYRKKYLEQYRNSELFYWRRFRRACRSGNKIQIVNSLYRWLDSLNIQEPTAQFFAQSFGSLELQLQVKVLEGELGRDKPLGNLDLEAWNRARREYFLKSRGTENHKGWINP